MALKTIRHGIFTWQSLGGSNCMAFHGQTVDIDNPDEIARGEREGAFFSRVGEEAPRTGKLPPLKSDPSDEEMKAWLVAGTTEEVLEAAKTLADSTVAKLADFEDSRKHPRTLLVEELRSSVKGKAKSERKADGSADDEVESILKASVKDFEKQVGEFSPELLDRLAVAESGKPEPRKGVLKAIEDAKSASKPEE